MGGAQGHGSEFLPDALAIRRWTYGSTGVGEGGWSFGIVPREPCLGNQFDCLGAGRNGQEIVERIDPIEPAGVDQTHEQIPGPGSVEGLVTETIFAVHNGHLESPFADVVVQRSSGLAQEQS